MEWWEVNRYLKGIRRRYHGQWETTRWLIRNVANMLSGKGSRPLKDTDIAKFPWEKEAPQEITDEEMAYLQAEMDALNGIQHENPQS